MKRNAVLAAAIALAVPFCIYGKEAAQDDLLEADQAFKPVARLVADPPSATARHGIDVEYRIAPGYYLYRDRLRFEVHPGTLPLAPPERPAAIEIDDPFLGKSAIYREKVVIHIPFTASVVDPGQYRVRVVAQGCAEDRLCFAPFTQEVPLTIPAGYRGDTPGARKPPPGLAR